MFEIIFYSKKNEESDIKNYLVEMIKKSETDKNARVNSAKILSYINSLAQYGTRVGQPVVKHLEGNLWELRPLKNRIIFFYWKDNKFVLLHHFIKKTQKTPAKELEQARLKLKDYLERFDNNDN